MEPLVALYSETSSFAVEDNMLSFIDVNPLQLVFVELQVVLCLVVRVTLCGEHRMLACKKKVPVKMTAFITAIITIKTWLLTKI